MLHFEIYLEVVPLSCVLHRLMYCQKLLELIRKRSSSYHYSRHRISTFGLKVHPMSCGAPLLFSLHGHHRRQQTLDTRCHTYRRCISAFLSPYPMVSIAASTPHHVKLRATRKASERDIAAELVVSSPDS